MDNDDSYSLQKFDAFICYRESEEGRIFAEITKKVLFRECHLNSFVAHEPRKTYSANFDKLREKIIEDCKFFIFINSEGAFDSTEIKKEFRMAYQYIKSERLELIILRHNSPQVKYRNEQFELETGIDLSIPNQASFLNEANLLDVIPDVFNNEKYSPYLNKTRAMLLEDYLKICITAVDKKDVLDKKSLNKIFVWNKTILISTDHWNTNEQEIPSSESEDWNIDKFLNSNERYVLVGAPFGIGKTSYSYMLAANMAEKYLTEFNSFIPIYVPLRDHFNNIDDNGNDFQTILSLVPNNQSKILFIFDGIDEYGEGEEITSLYNDRVKPYLKDYPNSKFLLTTRLKAGLPRHFYADKYVRLLSFSPEQVDEFMSKYGVNLRVSTIVQAGLSSDESGKALFCRMIAIIYDRKKTLQFGNDIKLNRMLLYHEFIHNIILGKDRHFSKNYDYEQHYLSEKRVLRKIAELKYIYGDSLTVKGVSDSIVNIDSEIREHFSELFDRLISAYFYIKDTHSYEKRIDFIHRSFIEYLLAEYYLESCLNDQMSNLNMSNLSSETISFLEGLLYIIKSVSNDTDSYFDQILKSFGLNTTKAELRSNLIRQGEKNFESEFLALSELKLRK